MDLRQKIQKDLRQALKNQEKSRLSILRLAWDGVVKKEKEKRAAINGKIEESLVQQSQLTDQELIQLLFALVKKGKEAISQFKQGNREDLVEKEEKEIKILQQYLPTQLKEDEIEKMAERVIKETKAESLREMGKVMAVLLPRVLGKTDGSVVSRIVKELLSRAELDD